MVWVRFPHTELRLTKYLQTMAQDNTYRNAPNTEFISHGEWCDPEIRYRNGILINANEFEENLYGQFRNICYENNVEYEDWEHEEEAYETWIENQGGGEFVEQEIRNFIYCYMGDDL